MRQPAVAYKYRALRNTSARRLLAKDLRALRSTGPAGRLIAKIILASLNRAADEVAKQIWNT